MTDADSLQNTTTLSSEAVEYLGKMPAEVLQRISFSMPWQYDSGEYRDPDKSTSNADSIKGDKQTRDSIQGECWDKFNKNPQISTNVRGVAGRLAGWGFETTSEIFEIQQVIEEIEEDPRNRLYNYYPKWVARAIIEGELLVCLTLHLDGFVEVDYIDPSTLSDKGDNSTGIFFHPDKPLFPLMYSFTSEKGKEIAQIPSIFLGRYPDLLSQISGHKDYSRALQQKARSRKHIYKKLGGYYKFIVSWDRGFMTRRTVSYLRTVLSWLNHYENLKKYEIDHKKASGAYAWVFSFEDPRSFKIWLALDDTDRRKTGVMQEITPGSRLVLPPGMKVQPENPNLTSIKEQDTDIFHMVSSGLNEAEDVTTGAAKGTFASVKASRGPMSDRISDEVAYWDRFLKFDFWGSIFFLRAAIDKFQKTFIVEEAIDFNENKEPVLKGVKRRPEKLIEIQYPVSETIDYESRARAFLGVKHGPFSPSIGVPNSEVARRLGMGGYGRMRLQKATEDEKYPELVYEQGVDAESLQETVEGEPSKKE